MPTVMAALSLWWVARDDLAEMRQAHGPTEKLFVDFAGETVPRCDRHAATRQYLRGGAGSVELHLCRAP